MRRLLRRLPTILPSLLVLLFLSISSVAPLQAQDTADTARFERGMQLYKQAKFDEAAEIFNQISTPEATLFSAKSYFGNGLYLKAQQQLKKIKTDAPVPVYRESQYTRALTAFQLRQYNDAVQSLYTIFNSSEADGALKDKAQTFYSDLMSYLTLKQRKEIFMSSSNSEVRLDILESLIGEVNFTTLKALKTEFSGFLPDSGRNTMQSEKLETALEDSLLYKSKYRQDSYAGQVPEGISYNIGVALPLFKTEKPEFEVVRGLYNGIVLAAEEFNRQHSDRKAFIRYYSTEEKNHNSKSIFNQLVWNQPIDAIIGPLFSESAFQMADLAEQYQVPMLTPLANSDTLNLDNPYVFQVNPTFSVRGRKMARYAVKDLNIDTIGVIAQKGAMGSESAYAFRDKAERLGAKVAYFFVEDFSATAYDLSDYTKYLTADERMRDTLRFRDIDAIYAPFTGKVSHTLIDLLLTDLEAANSEAVLLGSAEWESFDMEEKRRSKFDIYYPEADPLSADSSRYAQFDQAYQTRFDLSPTKFSYIGYDTAELLLETLHKVGNPAYLKQGLKKKSLFQGLTGPIDFRGRHINQEIEIKKLPSSNE